ncbi:hypothetical protein FB446DRAFT_675046, partial [Lentinula raphanica]
MGPVQQPFYHYLPPTPAISQGDTPEGSVKKTKSFHPSATGFNPGSTTDSPSLDSIHMRLERILHTIQNERWTVGTFLHYFSRVRDEQGDKISNRSRTHSQMLSQFLRGKSKHKPAEIVRDWVQSPLGIPNKTDIERDDMFSCTKPFDSIRCARPALTSFAAQLVQEHLINSASIVMSEEAGLHTFASGAQEIGEIGYGEETIGMAIAALKEHSPLFWHYCVTLATPNSRNR